MNRCRFNPLFPSFYMFEHYWAVRNGERLPLFRAVRSFPCEFEGDMELNELWKVHKECSREFWKEYPDIEEGGVERSFLDLKVEIVKRVLGECVLCERRCGVDRRKGRGFCGLGEEARVASHFLHLGEESVLIPSGTIFFSSCNFRCVYCQNWDISFFPDSGREVSAAELARMMEDLERRGAVNINLVGGEPTPNIPAILEAFRVADVRIPIVWNSNLYLTPEGMELIYDIIDLWLPDFKYGSDECALRLSSAPRYFEVVTRNLEKIRGRDVLVRHLVLPGHLECCTERILKWISENTPEFCVNVMFQYRPEWRAAEVPGMGRVLMREEIERALELAEKYGVKLCD